MAISRIIRELIRAGLVEEIGKRDRNGNPGRRQTDLRILSSGAYVVGLVISAFGHEVAVMDAAGNPVVQRKLVFDDVRNVEKSIEAASNAIISLIDESGIDQSLVLGVGVAIAATVESAAGTVVQAPFLGWRQVELGPEIARITGYPVIADSIANATNVTEQTVGKVRGYGDVFLVHTSTYCGASYTHQGNLIRGVNNSAGQIGHLPAGEGSLVCSCGANNCLDTRASGWSVLAKLGKIKSKRFRPENLEIYAQALSKLVAEDSPQGSAEFEAIFEAGWHLGRALQNISLIVDPQAIVLAGELTKSPAYEAGCRAAWTESPSVRFRNVPELIVGIVIPLQAAAFLALNSFFYSPRLDIDGLLAAGGRSELEAAS